MYVSRWQTHALLRQAKRCVYTAPEPPRRTSHSSASRSSPQLCPEAARNGSSSSSDAGALPVRAQLSQRTRGAAASVTLAIGAAENEAAATEQARRGNAPHSSDSPLPTSPSLSPNTDLSETFVERLAVSRNFRSSAPSHSGTQPSLRSAPGAPSVRGYATEVNASRHGSVDEGNVGTLQSGSGAASGATAGASASPGGCSATPRATSAQAQRTRAAQPITASDPARAQSAARDESASSSSSGAAPLVPRAQTFQPRNFGAKAESLHGSSTSTVSTSVRAARDKRSENGNDAVKVGGSAEQLTNQDSLADLLQRERGQHNSAAKTHNAARSDGGTPAAQSADLPSASQQQGGRHSNGDKVAVQPASGTAADTASDANAASDANEDGPYASRRSVQFSTHALETDWQAYRTSRRSGSVAGLGALEEGVSGSDSSSAPQPQNAMSEVGPAGASTCAGSAAGSDAAATSTVDARAHTAAASSSSVSSDAMPVAERRSGGARPAREQADTVSSSTAVPQYSCSLRQGLSSNGAQARAQDVKGAEVQGQQPAGAVMHADASRIPAAPGGDSWSGPGKQSTRASSRAGNRRDETAAPSERNSLAGSDSQGSETGMTEATHTVDGIDTGAATTRQLAAQPRLLQQQADLATSERTEPAQQGLGGRSADAQQRPPLNTGMWDWTQGALQ